MPHREPVHLREVLAQDTLTFNDLLSSLISVYPNFNITYGEKLKQLLSLLDTTGKVHGAAISYMTKDPNGHESLASGIVLRPLDRASRGMFHFFPSAKIFSFFSRAQIFISHSL